MTREETSDQLFGKLVTEEALLDALLGYWGTVSDLVQRQEHGGQKEGQPLVWEDGRRVVFQTAVVMFEIDRALSRPSSDRSRAKELADFSGL